MSKREHAEVTHVSKRGEGYHIKGVSKGKRVEFHIDAPTFESMSTNEATHFLHRTVHNLANKGED